MDSGTLREVEAFARRILTSYFCESDVEFLISTFAPDIVWMGAGEEQVAEGSEAVAACFRAGRGDLAPCDMTEERYVTRELGEDCYFCESSSWIRPKAGTGMYFRTHQRITFLFKRVGGELKAVHIHNSVSYSDIQSGELFPARAAREAYRTLENELVQRDRQIELMLSQLPGGMQICRADRDFSTKWISDSLCRLLGCSDAGEYAEATGNACRGFILREDYEEMWRQVSARLAHGDSYYVEYRARRRDGGVFWVSDQGKRVIDLDGEEAIYCFISDIGERKRREQQILAANRESERQARFLIQLYNSVPCGILQFSPEPGHRIINLNRMAWEYYGYASEADYRAEIHDPFQMVLSGDRARIDGIVRGLTSGGGTVSYTRRGRRRDGGEFWINVMMERLLNADGADVVQAVFTDFTEMKTLQLEQERERVLENRALRAAICTAYPLIMSVNLTRDTYDCFIEEQETYTARRGGSFDRLITESLPLVYPSYREDFAAAFSRREILRRFAAGERDIYMELREKGPDGLYHWVSVQIIYVPNPLGDDVLAIRLVKVLDAQRSEQARQEQLLRDALASARAANCAKSDFLSRMSHDIRTPMNAIIGMSAIGQLQIDDPRRVRDCFLKIDASSRYLLSLINDILDMSKIETGKMTISHERFDFAELAGEINSIIYPQTIERGLSFEVRHWEPLERCYIGDALRLKQILMNLLSNAIKFTPRGGGIIVGVREQERANGCARVSFTVEDTGVGMSEEYLSRIFQPFEQESPGGARNNVGSGLGLSIVYNLVQMMGGAIEVRSRKNEGSTFTVTLPFGLTRDGEEERLCKSRELLRGTRVLVVDDDRIVGEQTAAILGGSGARSVWVDSGAGAVEEVRAAMRRGGNYDIAIIDRRMPGMDGVETTRRIRELVGPDAMMILISAYDWSAIEEEARAAGASAFISKPLFRSQICDIFTGLAPNHRRSRPEPRREPRFSGQRVLLVEDNELNLEIAQSLLEMHGVEVTAAENGQLAVDAFAAAPEGRFFAVLMDIRMPVMDGLAATRAIRALDRGDAATVPILAMTANAFDEDRALAREAGMTGYLVKPLDLNVLFRELENLCGGAE